MRGWLNIKKCLISFLSPISARFHAGGLAHRASVIELEGFCSNQA